VVAASVEVDSLYAAQLSAFLLTVTMLVVVVLAMGWAQHMAAARRTARRRPPVAPLPLPFVASAERVDPAPACHPEA
jgi:hypothetical protein